MWSISVGLCIQFVDCAQVLTLERGISLASNFHIERQRVAPIYLSVLITHILDPFLVLTLTHE